MSEDNGIKLILLGMSGTGKTNIINALIDKPFDNNSESTLASSFVNKNLIINKKNYQLEIWDTAGQEMYKSLTKMFIIDSKIVIFVYDITQRTSFQELDFWIKAAKDPLGDAPIYAIFGNKKDLYLNEQVEEEEGKSKADEIGAYFRLTSGKSERENLNQYINELVELYDKKYGQNIGGKKGNYMNSFSLQNDKKNKNKQKVGCCNK